MNQALIDAWNSAIKDNDDVWHLGDFIFSKDGDLAQSIFDSLNGRKHLVLGNHDHSMTKSLPWVSVNNLVDLRLNKVNLVLCHYPLASWNRMHYGAVHLHGHVHSSKANPFPFATNRLDVGVDNVGPTPLSFDQVMDMVKTI